MEEREMSVDDKIELLKKDGSNYSKKEMYLKSIECYEEANKLDSGDLKTLLSLMINYILLKNFDKAKDILSKIKSHDESGEIYFFLNGFYFQLVEQSIEEAKNEFNKALELYLKKDSSNDPDEFSLISMIYFFSGDFIKAKEFILRRINSNLKEDLDSSYFIKKFRQWGKIF